MLELRFVLSFGSILCSMKNLIPNYCSTEIDKSDMEIDR